MTQQLSIFPLPPANATTSNPLPPTAPHLSTFSPLTLFSSTTASSSTSSPSSSRRRNRSASSSDGSATVLSSVSAASVLAVPSLVFPPVTCALESSDSISHIVGTVSSSPCVVSLWTLADSAAAQCAAAPASPAASSRELDSPVIAAYSLAPQQGRVIVVCSDASVHIVDVPSCDVTHSSHASPLAAAAKQPKRKRARKSDGMQNMVKAAVVTAFSFSAGMIAVAREMDSGDVLVDLFAAHDGSRLDLVSSFPCAPPSRGAALAALVADARGPAINLVWSNGLCQHFRAPGAPKWQLQAPCRDCSHAALAAPNLVVLVAAPQDVTAHACRLVFWETLFGTVEMCVDVPLTEALRKSASSELRVFSSGTGSPHLLVSRGGDLVRVSLESGLPTPSLASALGRRRHQLPEEPVDADVLSRLRAAKTGKAASRLISKHLEANKTSLSQLFVQEASRLCLEHQLWDVFTELLKSDKFSISYAPDVVTTLLEQRRFDVLEQCLVHTHNLTEDNLVRVAAYVLGALGPTATENNNDDDDGDVSMRGSNVDEVDHDLEVLLNLVVSAPRNDIFLLEALKQLPTVLVVTFLRYLYKWFHRYWLSTESALRRSMAGSRVPSFAQAIDWASLLLDAHMARLVLMPEAHRVVQQMHSLISTHHLGLCNQVQDLKGVLQHMMRGAALPKDAVSDYQVEVLCL